MVFRRQSLFKFVAQILIVACSLGMAFGATSCSHAEDSFSDALAAIKAIEPNGVGNESAVKAIKTLNSASIDQVPAILKAMDGANKISINWFRSAVLSIVARGEALPRKAIEEFFQDTSHSQMGRLLAFDLLTDGNQELADQMIPKLIDDPSMPLRRLAVKALIEKADASLESDPPASIGSLGFALSKARDVGQVQSIAEKLDSLGVKVNLQKQLGFLNTWHLVGSFNNKDMAGFDVAYGPEEAIGMIDLNAIYQDQNGEDVTWKQVTTDHATGNVDLNSLIGKLKGATVYALGNFKSIEDREAEIRIGTANATKIWVNGQLVMENEIYHNSNSIDKFKGKLNLVKGDNQILIKVCQNEQTEQWAQDWQFQLRICDETGKPIDQPKPPAPRQ